MIFGGALGWAHYKLRGGARTIGLTTGAYTTIVVVAILMLIRTEPRNRAGILDACTGTLGVLQCGILILFAGNAVRNGIRKDIMSGMIHSHRLMPISGTEGVAGFIMGSVAQAVCLAGANFLIGLFTTTGAGHSPDNWLIGNALLAVFAVFIWTAVALLSFLTQGAIGLLVLMIILGFTTGGFLMLLLPAVSLLLAPGLLAFGFMAGMPSWSAACQLSVPAQVVVGAFCFIGAARKFRREDVLAFSPLLGIGIVTIWTTLSYLGLRLADKILPGGMGRAFGPGDIVPAYAQVIASVLVGILICIVPVMGSAWLATQYHRRRLLNDIALGHRPIPPELTVLATTVILCLLPVYLVRLAANLDEPGWRTVMGLKLAYTDATVALNLLAISYLMRILYRVSNKSAIMVGVLIFGTWIGPLFLDFLRYGMSGMKPDDNVFTWISGCGPVGCLILLWGHFDASAIPGLAVQAVLAGIFGLMFYSTQQRTAVPEARAASLTPVS
jgi:hypothetical protein